MLILLLFSFWVCLPIFCWFARNSAGVSGFGGPCDLIGSWKLTRRNLFGMELLTFTRHHATSKSRWETWRNSSTSLLNGEDQWNFIIWTPQTTLNWSISNSIFLKNGAGQTKVTSTNHVAVRPSIIDSSSINHDLLALFGRVCFPNALSADELLNYLKCKWQNNAV